MTMPVVTVEDPTWTSQVDKFSDQIDDKIRTILIASKPIEQAPLTDLAQLQEFEFSMQGWLSDEDLQAYPNIYHGLEKGDNVADKLWNMFMRMDEIYEIGDRDDGFDDCIKDLEKEYEIL